MKAPARRSARAIAACLVLLGSQLVFVSTPSPATSESPCVKLTRWAQRYQGTSPSLDDIAKFDRPHRKAIFGAVNSTVRAELWSTHFTQFAQRPDLSPAQRALIHDAINLVTPAAYEHDLVATDALRRLWLRVEPVFTQGEHRRPWFDLGWTGEGAVVATLSLWGRLVRPFLASAQLPGCECNGGYGTEECSSGACPTGGCEIYRPGCGFVWQDWCNGMCLP